MCVCVVMFVWLCMSVCGYVYVVLCERVVVYVCVVVCVCVCVCVQSLSCVQLFITPWTVAHQALLSMGFSRQEYRNAILFSRGSSQPRDQTRVSLIADRFFTV